MTVEDCRMNLASSCLLHPQSFNSMPQRLAATMSIVAFVFCLLVGGFAADNALSTVLYRALIAMAGTFVVAYVVGVMARRMINESVTTVTPAETARRMEKFEANSGTKPRSIDR